MRTAEFNLEAALQADGVIESDVKEVIKMQLDNALKRRDDETQMTQIIGLMQPMLSRVKVRKSDNFLTSVNTTSMESYFGMLTFYIGFCHYQLHQYGSY